MEIPPAKLEALRSNIFQPAHAGICWQDFPWHLDKQGEIQTDKIHSSQGLAIDVFGSIKAASGFSRDAIMNELAIAAGLPPGGPWELLPEWSDPKKLLREKRRTQVDYIAFGQHSIMVIECKFTEKGGACSQILPIKKGVAAGRRQCTGRYELQGHPATQVTAHCTLSGKGIRYWDVIPKIFDLDQTASYDPCPFAGEAFQWMRNMTLADELGRDQGKAAGCVIAFAAGGNFPTEGKAGSTNWLPELAHGVRAPFMISYQQIAQIAAETDDSPIWPALENWVDSKVARVRRKGEAKGR